MNRSCVLIFCAIIFATTLAVAEETSWTKTLEDRAQRGKLQTAAQLVRGDTGRWNDAEQWVHTPAPDLNVKRFSLDNWSEKWSQQKFSPTAAEENWLVFSTRQLNDHDRVWIERIERRGNQFTIEVQQATWRGKYFKNFTHYQVLGVQLGKLEPGTYQAKCIVKPATFTQFEGTGQPLDNWPKDDKTSEQQPTEISTSFTVINSK